MLQPLLRHRLDSTRAERIAEAVRSADSIARLISAMRRHAKLMIACGVAGVTLGTIYVVLATPLYTASADIIIDNRQVRAVHDVSTLSDEKKGPDIAEVVESQVEVLRSEKIGLAVVKDLNLTEDPAFSGKLSATIGPAKSLDDADSRIRRQLLAFKTLSRHLRISRVAHTAVLQVAYTSPNPIRAAEIANAYTNAYLLDQLSRGVEATRRARSWLQQRTEELRQSSVEADLVAQKFKAEHNLLATKGTLISEQEFNEMTTQLVAVQAETARAQARYFRIKDIIDQHQTESAVTEYLDNPVINGLRTKYLDATNRLSELERERKLGSEHMAVVNLKNTVNEISTLLFQELGRIAQSYRSDYEVAASREKALAEKLAQQKSVAVAANDAQVRLHQLEQKAESFKVLYQSYLQRYQEAAQQESFPMTEGHVFSAANPPLTPSYPHPPIVLAISLALGIMAGAGIATLRELMDDVFRTVEQVRDELGVEGLGMLPIVPGSSLPELVPDKVAPILRYVIDEPFSEFAETLRSAKVAADLELRDRAPKIIGLVSLLPKEGKSTVAKNFASLLALQGAKTLLIDADTRNPVLTGAIGCKVRERSQSYLSKPPLIELLKDEPDSGLQILPFIYAEGDARVAEGLSPSVLHGLLQSSDQSFEYIVIDLPPIGPTVNARGMASAIDAFIFIVEWGMTSRGAVSAVLAKERSIRNKLLGVILNKVDMKKVSLYEHYRSDGYYRQLYENYYKRTTIPGN